MVGGRMNKITKSQDGIPRISLKVEVRLGAYDMAVHIINFMRFNPELSDFVRNDETLDDRRNRIENYLKCKLSGLSSKQILEIISDSIYSDGTERPHYAVAENNLNEAVDFLTGYLTRKYKGFGNQNDGR